MSIVTWDPRLWLKGLAGNANPECFLCGTPTDRGTALNCKEGAQPKLHVHRACAARFHPEVLRLKYLEACDAIARRPCHA